MILFFVVKLIGSRISLRISRTIEWVWCMDLHFG